jgi:hypothetical protein
MTAGRNIVTGLIASLCIGCEIPAEERIHERHRETERLWSEIPCDAAQVGAQRLRRFASGSSQSATETQIVETCTALHDAPQPIDQNLLGGSAPMSLQRVYAYAWAWVRP